MDLLKTSRTYSFGLMLAIIGILISLVTVGVSPHAQNSCVMQPADMAAWYPGDGNTNDILHGSNGTPQGNASYAAGQVGQAFSFDGKNSSLSIGNPESLRLQDFTIEAWVKRGSATVASLDPILGGYGSIFAYGQNGYAFFIGDDGHLSLHKAGVNYYVVSTGDGNFPDLKITDTNFHHVAVSKSGENVTFYLDGVTSRTQFFGVPFEFTTNANIGAYSDAFRFSFLGLIDELSIYKRGLNQSDIQAIFNVGAAGKCKATGVQFEFAKYPSGSASGTVTARVMRTGDTSGVSGVNYATADGTAKAGKNYTSTSGTLNFGSGEQSKTITVPILNDAATTTDTNFQLALSNAAGATLGAVSSATLNIFATQNGPGRLLSIPQDSTSSYLQAVNPDGTNSFQVTSFRYGTHADFPSVSRLTGLIAFNGCGEFLPTGTTCFEHGRRIYVMNSDGSGFRQVTTDAGLNSPTYQNDDRPVISPDGTKIAFISGRPPANDARPEVFVINTDGTGLHQITTHQNVQNVGESYAISVVWSPDSQKLLVHALRLDHDSAGNQTLNIGSLFTYNADGTGETPFRRNVWNSSMALDWSPDGRSILYPLIGGANAATSGYVILDALNPDKSSYLGGAQLGAAGDDYNGYAISGRFPGSVRFSPDGQKILYGDLSHSSLRTINLDGTNITSAPALSDSFYFAKWWWPGAAIPQPDHLTLTPNAVTVYGTQSAQVTPTLYDNNNNVIFHNADFSSTYTTGLLCSNHPCSVGNNALFESKVTANGQVYNNNTTANGVLTLCGANAGFNVCTLVAVNFESIGVSTTTPLIRKSGADGAGVFNFTRRLNPNSTSSSSQLVPFVLSGAAVNGTDYFLSDASGNRINGSVFTIPAGQNNFVIKVVPLITPGSGDKAVTLAIHTDDVTYNYVADGLNTSATITIKDDHPDQTALTLTSATPNKGGDGGSVTANIYGSNIKPNATVKLARSGQASVSGTNTTAAANGTFITATFDLRGQALGAWDVVVTNPDNTTATLPAAFTIEANLAAKVWIDIIGRYTMRGGLTQTFYFVYGNRGNVDAPPSEFRVFIPAPLQLIAIPVLDIPGIGRGSTPLVSRDEAGTTLAFAVPTVQASSSYYAPFQIIAPPELVHTNFHLTAHSFSARNLYDTSMVKVDPSVTFTPEVVVDTDTYGKIVQHVKSSTISGDITSEVFLQPADGPSDPIIKVTNDGTNISWEITATIPSSFLSASSQGTFKAKAVPLSGSGWTRVIHKGVAGAEIIKTGIAATEVYEAHEKEIEMTELLDCLLKKDMIAQSDYVKVKNALSARVLLKVSLTVSEGAGLLMKNPVLKGTHFLANASIEMLDEYGVEPAATGALIKGVCQAGGGGAANGGGVLGNLCAEIAFEEAGAQQTTEERHKLREQFIEYLLENCIDPPEKKDIERSGEIKVSGDPNEKDGPQGGGTQHFTTGKEPLRYVISFENVPTATAPAQTVVITDQLDTLKVDLSTVSLGVVGFSNYGAAPPSGLSSYTTDIDLRPAKNLIARINGQLDKNTGLLTWRFTSIDPATGQPTTDPLAGFLPPDKNPPEGQGSVTFSVMPKAGLATGTEIRNKSRIIFDANAPIDTNEYLNTIDNSLPASHVMPLEGVQSSIIFNVNWTGTDTGSGIQSYDVYSSENGGPFTLWKSNTTATSGTFIGKPGKRYSFYSVSRDGAGNLEPAKTSAESFTVTPNISNSIDDARFFVRQHYLDFLSRQPDQSGWDFWTNEITSCGANAQCIELKRINVSAAFYISIEFQETGYLVERIYKTSYGDAMGTSTFGGTHTLAVPIVRLNEFLPDTQGIGQGVVVGQTGWETVLENNKQAFTAGFVQRTRFTTAYPTTRTPAEFVDMLFANAGVTPSATDRNAAIGEFNAATNTTDTAARGRALRRVAENSTLNQREFNRAFVLMQYLGYLRRNPNGAPDSDYSGYDFWLTKLNQFNGNFVNAEMVKAFIVSGEYRQRFGP